MERVGRLFGVSVVVRFAILCFFWTIPLHGASATAIAVVEKGDKIAVADQLLAQNEGICEKYFFTFRDKRFVGYPNVYSPVIFPGANKQTDLLTVELYEFRR